MTITVELPMELERKLKELAAATGKNESELAAEVLQSHLSDALGHGDEPRCETDLLSAISAGPSETWWNHYRSLISRRENGIITDDELVELCELSERLEEENVRRLETVKELAALRGVPHQSLLDELEIAPQPVN